MQDKLQSAYNRLWLEASASCKTVELFFWAVHVPAIPHQRPSAWHREARTSVTWSFTHGTPFKLASEMKSDWCSLQHKYTEWKHWHRFYPKKKTIWKPLAHGLVVNFDRQSGPTFGCDVSVWTEPDNWVKVQWKTGLDNTVSTTPDVVTGSHQLPRLDTMVATFIVYRWWLSNPCSWISKIVGSQIPGWCCVQVSFQGSRAIISQIMTGSVLLFNVCHCFDWTWFSVTHPNPPILTTTCFCCFNIFIYSFLHHKSKIHVEYNKQPTWQHIYFFYFFHNFIF